VGLQRPLFTADFSLFDPFDERHWVTSHHLAHAASAVFASGFDAAAVLVSDSAGSSSVNGEDFVLPFLSFHNHYAADAPDVRVQTEMRSIYSYIDGELSLRARDYVVPHNQPDVHVQSEASLFDNVARYIFRAEHSHGQFMALAGLPYEGVPRVPISSLITTSAQPRLRNGWQAFAARREPADNADVADVVQQAFTELLVAQARRAVTIADQSRLVCAGGVFLNLGANSAIAELPEVDDLYVPSSPHDAGIAIGAAFVGWWQVVKSADISTPTRPPLPERIESDFLGPEAMEVTPTQAEAHGFMTAIGDGVSEQGLNDAVVDALLAGRIVARFAGRAEFGPRALGNRSLLAHPVRAARAKDKLNRIKKRQTWRPVAPVVREEDVSRFFDGPKRSPFMNFNFAVLSDCLDILKEAAHVDGTARVQTVNARTNAPMYAILTRLDALGEVPVLLNTSFNGPGQPIIDDSEDALTFSEHPLIDYLVTNSALFNCAVSSNEINIKTAPGSVLAAFGQHPDRRYLVSGEVGSVAVGEATFLNLISSPVVRTSLNVSGVQEALQKGLLIEH
jgi:carbamoyltransferase